MTYTMNIEKPVNVVKQHGFHLGTDRAIAESFVLERLRNDPEVISIALRCDGRLDRFYDWQDVSDRG
jgi:hypothetical protein